MAQQAAADALFSAVMNMEGEEANELAEDVQDALELAENLVRGVEQTTLMMTMLQRNVLNLLRAGAGEEDRGGIDRALWLDFLDAWATRTSALVDGASQELNLLNLAAMVQGYRERWPAAALGRINQLVPLHVAADDRDRREWREVPNIDDNDDFRDYVQRDLPRDVNDEPIIPANAIVNNNRRYCGNDTAKADDAVRSELRDDYNSVYGYRGVGSRLYCIRRGFGAGQGRGGGGGGRGGRGGGRGGGQVGQAAAAAVPAQVIQAAAAAVPAIVPPEQPNDNNDNDNDNNDVDFGQGEGDSDSDSDSDSGDGGGGSAQQAVAGPILRRSTRSRQRAKPRADIGGFASRQR